MAKKEAAATQKFVHIDTIRENTIVLKNGGLRQIVMVSGMNFDLKSEEEQGLVTYTYQSFLNSLNFSLQIFIHSRRLNIADYLQRLDQLQMQETNELLKAQIAGYREFVQSFVGQNPIMSKTFFVIVPFDPIQLSKAGAGILGTITGVFKKQAAKPSFDEAAFQKNLQQLSQRVDQTLAGLNSIGLRAVTLTDEELTELFYNLYNPEAVERKLTQQ